MTELDVVYEGDLSTRSIHLENGAVILTDAPKDNQGLGRFFSPTDLLGAALGSCVLTLMGIAAKRLGIDLSGTRAHITKEMHTVPPRRLKKVTIEIFCPHSFDAEAIARLKEMGEKCPVHHSLHPDVEQLFIYHWGTSP